MMTVKQFVNEQDDHLDSEILISKYNDYNNKRTWKIIERLIEN